MEKAAEPPKWKRTKPNDAYKVYEEIIKDNIKYRFLLQDKKIDRERPREIVDLILETVCSSRKKIHIAGDNYPAEIVKAKFMKLDSEHIHFVLDWWNAYKCCTTSSTRMASRSPFRGTCCCCLDFPQKTLSRRPLSVLARAAASAWSGSWAQ